MVPRGVAGHTFGWEKNLTSLVEWYGKDARLRELVHLVMLGGDRLLNSYLLGQIQISENRTSQFITENRVTEKAEWIHHMACVIMPYGL